MMRECHFFFTKVFLILLFVLNVCSCSLVLDLKKYEFIGSDSDTDLSPIPDADNNSDSSDFDSDQPDPPTQTCLSVLECSFSCEYTDESCHKDCLNDLCSHGQNQFWRTQKGVRSNECFQICKESYSSCIDCLKEHSTTLLQECENANCVEPIPGPPQKCMEVFECSFYCLDESCKKWCRSGTCDDAQQPIDRFLECAAGCSLPCYVYSSWLDCLDCSSNSCAVERQECEMATCTGM